jgi:hypothetical protein
MNPRRGVRRLRPAGALLGVVVGAGWAGSCPGRAPAPAAAACARPADGSLAAGTRADGLAGAYRLTLVAERGTRAGSSTSGPLSLEPFGARPVPVPAGEGVRHPLFGGTGVDLQAVGAVALGDVSPANAARPGVLAMEWARPGAPAGMREITLRLGADANHGDLLRFDAAYTALTVTSLSGDGFGGTWRSGTGGGQAEAGGYFCAERVAARG